MVMRAPSSLARSPALRNAVRVASTEVNTTHMFNRDPVRSVSIVAGTDVPGANVFSNASNISTTELKEPVLKKSWRTHEDSIKTSLRERQCLHVRIRVSLPLRHSLSCPGRRMASLEHMDFIETTAAATGVTLKRPRVPVSRTTGANRLMVSTTGTEEYCDSSPRDACRPSRADRSIHCNP